MRSTMISFRVEPETSRMLTWLVNKHNYECNDTLSKSAALERLIERALDDPTLLEETNNDKEIKAATTN